MFCLFFYVLRVRIGVIFLVSCFGRITVRISRTNRLHFSWCFLGFVLPPWIYAFRNYYKLGYLFQEGKTKTYEMCAVLSLLSFSLCSNFFLSFSQFTLADGCSYKSSFHNCNSFGHHWDISLWMKHNGLRQTNQPSKYK